MSTVGIVLVSHSPKIADGLKDLLSQAVKNVAIATAGGTDEEEIGTSLEKIQQAIEKVHSDKGTLLLFDLGSSLMNAEMAVELAEDDSIKIADAPFVEGSYVAAVEAGMGKSLDEVLRAAEETREQKKKQ
ncbi:dihydroxyacetone kinase phosphoryl donor subunit DhaM [Bacillus testis]|uniref:dihydroxyacetone kinase phosphoryl donor subunit DhaM n=1 Tax=Bacillus testis TaxID=1622072 RepID=UPI00067EAAFA|nr:dihydroxyacetone kinase phosphoryl donor subunit DhaM [Bacillus testis]